VPLAELRPGDLVGHFQDHVGQIGELLRDPCQDLPPQQVLQADAEDLLDLEPAQRAPLPLQAGCPGHGAVGLVGELLLALRLADDSRLQQPLEELRVTDQDIAQELRAPEDGEEEVQDARVVPEQAQEEAAIQDRLVERSRLFRARSGSGTRLRPVSMAGSAARAGTGPARPVPGVDILGRPLWMLTAGGGEFLSKLCREAFHDHSGNAKWKTDN
jgi:hypothetical protein